MDSINNAAGTSYKKSKKEEKAKLITLSIYDNHLIRNIQFFSLNKPSSRELYNVQIIRNNEKLTVQSYCNYFFCTANLDLRKIHLLPRKTTINTKIHLFQYKVLK